MDTMMKVPILTAYFSYSGRCLHMNEGTIVLPPPLDTVHQPMKAQHKVWDQTEYEWKTIFWLYDIIKNTKSEQPRVLMKPDRLNRVSFDGYDRDSFGRVVKIVQFFGRSGREYLSNQALVTYYYNNKTLCSFQICTKLKHTLTEIEQFERLINATAMERKAFMGWYLTGHAISENPFGFTRNRQPLDYFQAYRFACILHKYRESDEVYEKYDGCFVFENEYDINDDISDNLFDEMYKKYMDADPDDDLDEWLDDTDEYDQDDEEQLGEFYSNNAIWA